MGQSGCGQPANQLRHTQHQSTPDAVGSVSPSPLCSCVSVARINPQMQLSLAVACRLATFQAGMAPRPALDSGHGCRTRSSKSAATRVTHEGSISRLRVRGIHCLRSKAGRDSCASGGERHVQFAQVHAGSVSRDRGW